jgi:hypothetical protein
MQSTWNAINESRSGAALPFLPEDMADAYLRYDENRSNHD